MPGVAVIILNWNGVKLLKEYLPSVVKYTNPALARVVVVDNASSDASAEVVRQEFPQVELICFDANYGFAGGYNRAIEQIEEDIVVLLNSDVEVTEGWLEPLAEVLEHHAEVAAVQPKIKSWKNKSEFEYAGACGGFIDRWGFPFCRGRILNVVEKDSGQYDDEAEVFWCSGAALCIRREVYLEAGGLDERFFAHMEEIDLCWRIRNSGKSLKVCPESVVYHLGGGSLPMNHPHKLFLNYRNNLLMLYKNLASAEWKRMSWRRKWLDFTAMLVFLLKGETENVKSVIKAYKEFNRMKTAYRQPACEHADPCIYQGCIIFQYYFRHIRTFARLWK